MIVDFAARRTWWEAILFAGACAAAYVMILVAGYTFYVVAYERDFHQISHSAAGFVKLLSVVVCPALNWKIVRAKRLRAPQDLACVPAAALLSLFLVGAAGFIPIAYLATRPRLEAVAKGKKG